MNGRIGNLSHELRPTPGAVGQEIVIDNTVQVAAPMSSQTTHVLVTLADAPAHVTFDGSDPAVASGHVVDQNVCYVWRKEMALASRWSFAGAVNARLNLTELTY